MSTTTMDIHEIMKRLPHRYPFLLVDRVLELDKGVRIKALKNVTMNEQFFVGHFPNRPVMPGVMMLEALAQASAILAFDQVGVLPDEKTMFYFVGIAGSAVIGRYCTIGGAGMIAGHLEIADHVHISGGTLVSRSILKPGVYTGVFPIDENANWEKNAATLRQLYGLRDRLRSLERAIGSKTTEPNKSKS